MKPDFDSYKPLTWASYHANLQSQEIILPAISTEKADTPAMIKHAMTILKPSPVMACNCPIFAKAKFILWTRPTSHSEDIDVWRVALGIGNVEYVGRLFGWLSSHS